MSVRSLASLLISALLATCARAEAQPVEFATQPGDAQPGDEQTLPEVVVTPDEDQPDATTAPPVSQPPTNFDPFADSTSFPSLANQAFDGLSGALRGSRSIFDDPRNVTITTRRDLTERAPQNMVDALQGTVGVLMQQTGRGQASPFIRGLTGPETLLLVDGIRLNNSTFRFGPNQYFGVIDPGMIERIEVVRGPQSVLWGSDAIGGVINVVTRSADGFGRFDYFGGGFTQQFSTADLSPYSRLNVEGSTTTAGLFTGGSYLDVNNLDRGGSLGRQPFTDYSQEAGDLKFDYMTAVDQWLTVSLQHVEQMDVPRSDRFPGEERRFDPQQRNLAYIRWQGVDTGGFFDAFMFTGSFGRQKEGTLRRRPPTSTDLDVSEFDVETTNFSGLLANDFGWLGRVTYGADWYHDEVDATARREDLTTGISTPRTPQFPTDSFYETIGTFLQWEVDVTQRIGAIAGTRYTNADTGATVALFDTTDPLFPNIAPVPTPLALSFQDWVGSVGLVYRATDFLNLVGSVSEGFRTPTLDELTSVSSNVNEGVDLPSTGVGPQTSINYELGLKLDAPRARGQFFYFWTDIDGLIDRVLVATDPGDPLDPDDDVDFFERRNIGQAQINGCELAGEYLLSPCWSAYGNFWYTLGQNTTANEPVSRIPPTQGTVGLRYRDPCGDRWFDVYGWLVDRQDRLSARDIRDSRIPDGGTPGYGTLNFRVGQRVTRSQLISVNLFNVLDKAYRVHGSGVDGPGITATLGYQLRR